MSDALDTSGEAGDGDSVRIVRVDEDGEAGRLLAAALRRRERRVAIDDAVDPAAARETVGHGRVDCVVADWAVVDAAFVEAVRERDAELPCVVYASSASPDAADRALAAGATDVVEVPDSNGADLAANRIARFVEGYRAQRRASTLESDLREKTNLLHQIFEQIPAALYVKDREGRHLRMSDYDVSPDATVGKTDVEIYGDTEFSRETYRDDLRVVETGESIVNKEEYNPNNGEWTITSKVPWYGEHGDVKGLIGVSRIITEEKEYERELKRANERLEKFAGIVSHDLRNPLNVATGHLEAVAAERDDESLAEIRAALDRIDALIEDLLTLARQGQTIEETRSVGLAGIAGDAWSSVHSDDASLEVESDCSIEASEPRLRQLFENLFRNAVEHGAPDDASSDGIDGDDADADADAADADDADGVDLHVRVGTFDDGIYVADDGVGIPVSERGDVLEDGVTTADDGTGFGLTIVQEIAAAHGWDVGVSESRDGGARFELLGVDRAE